MPEKNREKLKKLCEEEGFNSNDKDIITKIQNYYKKSYVYSLYCGTTPDDEDFVNYFIDTKKGFCAHFASTAVLILRTLGIPARYVEGYVITGDMIEKGQIIANKSDYIVQESTENNYNAIEVRVPDSRAHAWIEVYKEGFGWVPYEMTVYNRKEEVKKANNNGGNQILGWNNFITSLKNMIKKQIKVINRYSKYILMIILGLIVAILLIVVSKYIYEKIRKNRRINSEDYNTNMIWLVSYLFRVFKFYGCERRHGITVDEYFTEVKKKHIVEDKLLDKVSLEYKKAGFSDKGINETDYKEIKEYVEKTVKIKYNDLSLKEKIKFQIECNLL